MIRIYIDKAFGDKPISRPDSGDYGQLQERVVVRPDSSAYDSVVQPEPADVNGMPVRCPLSLKKEDGDWWQMPHEPVITVNGKNVITKKQVAKGRIRGSIKERWSQDDYRVTISGVLIGMDGYPSDDVKTLKACCEAGKVQVMSPLLELFSIDQIVIENFNFPHTAGQNNQSYTITASSDEIYKLLLKKEDLKLQ